MVDSPGADAQTLTLGRFAFQGWTCNDFDGNLTTGSARLRFGVDGSLSGSIDWGSGTNYNPAESSPLVGFWSPSGIALCDLDHQLWTQADENVRVAWKELFHHGGSLFCYSGSFIRCAVSDEIGSVNVGVLKGRYQMHDYAGTAQQRERPAPHGTGSFEFKLAAQPGVEAEQGACIVSVEQAMLPDNGEDCAICMSCPSVAGFLHGGTVHRVCCDACAARVLQRRHTCPVCRQVIEGIQR
eukprot:TRINITY_DN49282_c0_g1_i1.p1 TRINITY_DN49282_c0_g1~~TRINITY_DN49282_c0_g1_i1.p1  ORF type:complete len:255 (+),score=21.15 TRINITY_DN49282_c0_g1_i1:48-767(+)